MVHESIGRTRDTGVEFIQSGKYSTVYFDPERRVYIKYFRPKAFDRLRYWLGIRPAPGRNFLKIARRLERLDIKVPDILMARRYYLEMREVEGTELRGLLPEHPELQQQYVELIARLYQDHIYCRGLHTKNFLATSSGELVAIDLDAYKAPRLFHYSGHDFLEKLKRSLTGEVDELYLYQRIVERLGVANAP